MSENSTEPFPQKIPLKVIGRQGTLDPLAIRAVITKHLGEQEKSDWQTKKRGEYISFTFWVVLPNANAEEPMRKAIHALPGVVMQL